MQMVVVLLALVVFNPLSAIAPTYGCPSWAGFLSGLPHGAYFGVAAVLGSSPEPRRSAPGPSRGAARPDLANVVGVPAATWLGEMFGWRSAYVAPSRSSP